MRETCNTKNYTKGLFRIDSSDHTNKKVGVSSQLECTQDAFPEGVFFEISSNFTQMNSITTFKFKFHSSSLMLSGNKYNRKQRNTRKCQVSRMTPIKTYILSE